MTAAFDIVAFTAKFPEMAALPAVADGTYWDVAVSIMSPEDGCLLAGKALQYGLELLTAHLAKLGQMAAAGIPVGSIASGTEGSVTVAFNAPPFKSGWQFWLSTTTYGAQLWALLQVQSAGGLYVGGLPERAAFRKVGGVF